jgi:Flp pilus assembly protein TadG
MRVPEARRRRRYGVTAVETAMVLMPLMLFLFTIFEYGRYVLIRHLVNLSAEMACRYAIVHTASPTLTNDIKPIVNNYMGGMNTTTHFTAPVTVTVYSVPTALWDPTVTNVNPTSWTVQPPNHAQLLASSTAGDAAANVIQPGSPLGVQVSGSLKTMFPTLLFLPVTIPIQSMVILTCEGV